MVTLSQRIEQLRTEKNLSRPALASALGFPKTSIEKFETGRQTPSQEQQEKLASFFSVSLFYLRGENNDRTRMDDWMDGAFLDEPQPAPVAAPAPKKVHSGKSADDSGNVFDAFLSSKKFQEALQDAVLHALRSPEGCELLRSAIRSELRKLK